MTGRTGANGVGVEKVSVGGAANSVGVENVSLGGGEVYGAAEECGSPL